MTRFLILSTDFTIYDFFFNFTGCDAFLVSNLSKDNLRFIDVIGDRRPNCEVLRISRMRPKTALLILTTPDFLLSIGKSFNLFALRV